ncbi:hypothetical protein R6Q59_012002 [Mikania micrantha]|uniref:Uncharacterized protein n=1 Tax=Mikania micrantha TaxID=192012 RepID=A0A5N6LN86_9ASTR|nr:hypothetical protein E3N88_40677 [Mikania micrantha]
MKMRNKGKVYPSSSSSTPATSPAGDFLSVLNLLPAAILTLTVVLSVEDREVLAYMITRSIKLSNPASSTAGNTNKNKTPITHKLPVFDCDCFDCYTSYWFKWDTSVNRELIHQAIEAFEENLSKNEQSNKKGKKKEKMSHRRLAGKPFSPPDSHNIQMLPQYDVALVEVKGEECAEDEDGIISVPVEHSPETTVVGEAPTMSHRKVLPDVMGLFNWRSWNIWSPNV